jgi:methylglutaconyl-CoA hydratase
MPLVLIDAQPGITTLTLNRPERRNALTVELLEELCAALDNAGRDASTRVVILRGSASSFSSGFDLAESQDEGASIRQAELLVKVQLLLAESDKICIAVAHGYALAGGGALIAACDFAFAAADAQFGYPVLRVGVVPTPGMPFLRHELNDRDFRALVLGGELWNAERAHAAGLVNSVFETVEEAYAEALRVAALILASSPAATTATKGFANEATRKNLRQELSDALEVFIRTRKGEEAREGLSAFLEKRKPNWG